VLSKFEWSKLAQSHRYIGCGGNTEAAMGVFGPNVI
jgi:hypothetical protein